MMYLLLLLLCLVLAYAYYKLRKRLHYWKDLGVPYEEPLPLFGNFRDGILLKDHFANVIGNLYRKYENEPFVGVFNSINPCLLVRDPQFVRNILIKDFKSFAYNYAYADKAKDPIWGRNPFVLRNEEWKNRRTEISPAFSSNRLKMIYPYTEVICKRLVENIKAETYAAGEDSLLVKQVCLRYTIDNVLFCLFGVDGKSDMRQVAETLFTPGGWTGIALLLMAIYPGLCKFFGIKVFRKKMDDAIISQVKERISDRKSYLNQTNTESTPTFLDYLISHSTGIEDDVSVAAHVASFFVDGYQSSATTMSWLLFELACNPDSQDQLRNEINTVLDEKYNGEFCYEAIQELKFLRACLRESMRLHPIGGAMLKECSQKYTYTTDGEKYKKMSVTLNPGDCVIISDDGMCRDEQFYPEANKFKPERYSTGEFSDEVLFLGFGEGPRTCVGKRFASLQIEMAVSHIIKNFQLKLSKKTVMPLKVLPYFVFRFPANDVWVDFKTLI